MRFLLDTNVMLWSSTEDRRLSLQAVELINSNESEVFISPVSTWEIVIKYALGRLPLPEVPATFVPKVIQDLKLQSLDVTHRHAIEVGRLPKHHHDPFDRMLVAQARVEGMTLLTSDRNLRKYDVEQFYSRR
jgi:PIN domain nuclease of toxin-antitoxin system